MDSSPPPYAYVDPRVVFAVGCGVTEPNYDGATTLPPDGTMDLDEKITTPSSVVQLGRAPNWQGQASSERDASAAVPPATARSTLRPEAPEFVPERQRQPILTLDTAIQIDPTAIRPHSITPSTPRITLSRPSEGRNHRNGASPKSSRRN